MKRKMLFGFILALVFSFAAAVTVFASDNAALGSVGGEFQETLGDEVNGLIKMLDSMVFIGNVTGKVNAVSITAVYDEGPIAAVTVLKVFDDPGEDEVEAAFEKAGGALVNVTGLRDYAAVKSIKIIAAKVPAIYYINIYLID